MEHGGSCSDEELLGKFVEFEFLKRGILPFQIKSIPKKDVEVYMIMFQKENELKAKALQVD
jgi:hypothetical protein